MTGAPTVGNFPHSEPMADINGVVILDRGFLELALDTVSACSAEPSFGNIINADATSRRQTLLSPSASLGGSSSDPRPLLPSIKQMIFCATPRGESASDPLDFVLAVLASVVCESDLLAEGGSGDPVLQIFGRSMEACMFRQDAMSSSCQGGWSASPVLILERR